MIDWFRNLTQRALRTQRGTAATEGPG